MKIFLIVSSLFIFPEALSQSSGDTIVNDKLVLINIAGFSRDDIALIIQRAERFEPKVIGIDAWFTHIKSDTLLLPTLYSYNNIVLAVKLFCCQNNKCDSITGQYFPYVKEGHVMVNYKKLKYVPSLRYQYKNYPFFCLALLKEYDASIVDKFYKRKVYKKSLKYYGNYNSFITIEGKEFLMNRYSQSWDLKGKIIILGYLGRSIGKVKDPLREIDYKRTELSQGKLPDMYGVILLANILTDIMRKTK